MNGKHQRNALTAAERALTALGAGDGEGARRAVARAVELDQLGIYEPVSLSVGLAADDLDHRGVISEEHWDLVAAAVPQGPLEAVVERIRTS